MLRLSGASMSKVLRLRSLNISLMAMALAGLTLQSATAEESKSFVVSWFTPASYSTDDDCPGRNPSIDGIYRHAIKQMGLSPDEEERLFAKFDGTTGGDEAGEIIINRARIDGVPANAYANPMAAPDPNMLTVTGPWAIGFDLDGKGADDPNTFKDPFTNEHGIDNEFFRAMGCHTGQRAYWPHRVLQGGEYQWDTIRLSQPAWLITIVGEDLERDGDVIVTFDRALESTKWDAQSNTRADMTYRIDPNPRSRNVFKARLEDGVVKSTESANFNMVADPYYIQEFRFRDAQIRLNLMPDGKIDGFVGGYQPFVDPYWGVANGGLALECCAGIDFIGMYHTLRKLADAYPDPNTGQNTHISTTYRVEAVPAFVVHHEDMTAKADDEVKLVQTR
ncbi:MAG TPA: hypothetical protein DGZ24_06020 [Rhodospirillaceae bacterium]|nr:hypothetical protein [Candidatus Neomarinimicrobiota bacterium]HCX14856.1 hypothetical protein [Rhodospirillaceae bacterium]